MRWNDCNELRSLRAARWRYPRLQRGATRCPARENHRRWRQGATPLPIQVRKRRGEPSMKMLAKRASLRQPACRRILARLWRFRWPRLLQETADQPVVPAKLATRMTTLWTTIVPSTRILWSAWLAAVTRLTGANVASPAPFAVSASVRRRTWNSTYVSTPANGRSSVSSADARSAEKATLLGIFVSIPERGRITAKCAANVSPGRIICPSISPPIYTNAKLRGLYGRSCHLLRRLLARVFRDSVIAKRVVLSGWISTVSESTRRSTRSPQRFFNVASFSLGSG